MNAAWAKLETHVVNGAFSLQRCVGGTAHSGVFLTQSTPHAPSAVALKLIPFDPDSAQARLARWRAAAGLSHPHLLRIFEAGECSLDGVRYLYVRMEFADQTLAQVLEGRALTEDEVREMLAPTLDVLEYLHQRQLVHGGLKPSNFLVVGNELKLASDTMRAVDEADANASAAADVHALGFVLCEALMRRRPAVSGSGEVTLPPELPVSLREVVARCLKPEPRDRPTVAMLQAWLRGEPLAAEAPAPPPSPPAATRLVIRVDLSANDAPEVAEIPQRARWRVLPLTAVAVVLVVLVWVGFRVMSPDSPRPQDQPPRVEVVPAVTQTTTAAAVPASEPPPAVASSIHEVVRRSPAVRSKRFAERCAYPCASPSTRAAPSPPLPSRMPVRAAISSGVRSKPRSSGPSRRRTRTSAGRRRYGSSSRASVPPPPQSHCPSECVQTRAFSPRDRFRPRAWWPSGRAA